jgi:chromosome segregation ATPase
MADGLENLPERVEAVEGKLDGLAASVETRFDQVDRRFDQVDQRFEQVQAALIEQRRYTEFAYERLDSTMDAGFARIDAKLEAVDATLVTMDVKIDGGLANVGGHITRLERKLDQFIDLHLSKSPPREPPAG